MKLPLRLRADATTPLLVLMIGVIASVLATVQFARMIENKDKERFEHSISQAQESIAGRLQTYLAMLHATAGLFASRNGQVHRDEFHRFVQQLQLSSQYPGVQGIGFSLRLPTNTTTVSPDVWLPYTAAPLRVYPEGERDEVHAIVYIEPLDRRNRAALGYDMFSEAVRREAMERARDSGRPAVSGRVQLVQEIDRSVQAGFLIYLPVYRTMQLPRSVAARREALLGFVYSPFRADDLMRGIFGSYALPRLDLEIYDGPPDAKNLLHRSAKSFGPHRYSAMRTMNVAGRQWSIRYGTRREFEVSSSQVLVPYVLIGGLLATFIATALTASQARARGQADKALHALRTNARKLEVLHHTAARLAAELDLGRVIEEVTTAAGALSGAEIAASFFRKIEPVDDFPLVALTGAVRESFAGLSISHATPIVADALAEKRVVRIGDIMEEPRYAALEQCFPLAAWNVRSLLCVPVTLRSGDVLGALLLTHSTAHMFTEETARSMLALAGHAAVAIDNARLFTATQDEIRARKRIEEHQSLLLGELNHRVKNTLSTVQSIASQTLRASPDLRAFKDAFEARLIALSEAHNLLSRSNWRGVDLRDLVARELAPHGIDDPGRVRVTGESVWLPPGFAVALGMALHELATNAARHGALRSPNGHVAVTWSTTPLEGKLDMQLVWEESGGPPVSEPTRRGFGSRMIEQGLKHDLHGEATLYFHGTGLKCVIRAAVPMQRALA